MANEKPQYDFHFENLISDPTLATLTSSKREKIFQFFCGDNNGGIDPRLANYKEGPGNVISLKAESTHQPYSDAAIKVA